MDIDDILKLSRVSRVIKPRIYQDSLCIKCRGRDLLCGKPICPVITEYKVFLDSLRDIDREDIHGSSPPSIFVGRIGYPKVVLGAMVPPESGDTSLYDYPERWDNLGLIDILRFRSRLVMGWYRVDRNIPSRMQREYMDLLDISLSRTSPEVEMGLKARPVKVIDIDEDITPFGPRAPVKKISIGTLKIDYKILKRVEDWDLRAGEAVIELYREGVDVSRIIRVFSIGGLGVKRNRVLVPTRWSITAVDDIIGRWLYTKVRGFPPIDKYLVFEYSYLENRYVALMIPETWMYEFMEAWYPGTFWNRVGEGVIVEGDYEIGRPRKEYAEIGGCYYAARLATLEYLHKIGRTAGVVIFREAYPGYIFPVGVWSVRESVRRMYRRSPIEFGCLEEALEYIYSRLRTPSHMWRSRVLEFLSRQRRISDYL